MTEEGPGLSLKLRQWLKYNYPQVLTLLGTVAVGTGSIGGLVDKEAWGWFAWAIGLGVIATAVGGVAGLAKSPSVVRLIASERRSRERAETLVSGIRSAFSGELAQVLRFINRYEPGARASLYLHVDETFQIVSRSSSDPNLRSFGRTSYPPSQGVIGRAWSDSEAVAVDLPKRRDHWNSHMARNYGFSEAEAGRLRMQSRSLVALRIDHDGPAGARPLGVVVLESVKPTAIGSDERDSIMGSAEWRMFSAAVIGGLDALRSASFSVERPSAQLAGIGDSDEAASPTDGVVGGNR